MSGSPHRLVEVAADRLPGWIERFAARHGECVTTGADTGLTLRAADGAVALLESPFPEDRPGAAQVADLAARARLGRHAVLLLIRRGGYAVGVTEDGRLISHKVGTRYVQGRTAAGGWSQQRFARRREGQTSQLVGAATDALVAQPWRSSRCLVAGGDRTLIQQVLDDPRLSAVAALPRSAVLEVGDPRLRTLEEAATRATAIRIRLNDLA